jgi:hypothetical protein
MHCEEMTEGREGTEGKDGGIEKDERSDGVSSVREV